MRPLCLRRRANTASVLTGLVAIAVLGLAGCGEGDDAPSARPSDPAPTRSVDRPTPDEPESETESTRSAAARPTRSVEPEQTEETPETPAGRPTTTEAEPEPTRTTQPATPTKTQAPTKTQTPTKTQPPTEAEPPADTQPPVALPPATKTTPPASPEAAASESTATSPWGWLLVIALIVALAIGGLLVYRTQRKSDWDNEGRALEAEARALTTTRLPQVLTATTAAQRALTWPPVRAGLVDLIDRWNALALQAPGEPRRDWAVRVSGLLQQLVAAVDAENDALANGQDWALLRPRVNDAARQLAAVLTAPPQPPPPAAEPGPPAYET